MAGLLLATGTSVASVLGTLRAFAQWCHMRLAGERRMANEDALGFPAEEAEAEYRVQAIEPLEEPVLDQVEDDEEEQTAEHELILEPDPEPDPLADDPLEVGPGLDPPGEEQQPD